MKEGSRKAVFAALLANSSIAVAKFVAYAISGSASMLAEGVHSVADSGNQALLLLGGQRAKREPTREHPFGYGRERYFWAFVVAVVLFALGGVFALYEGIQKLLHPHSLESPLIAVAVLMFGMVAEGFSFRTAIIEGRQLKGSESWWNFIRHSKSPELPVILLEDLGALTGLTLALGGVGLAWVTGDGRFDAAGSMAIGLLLGAISIVLAIEMKSLLIGEAATPRVRAQIDLAFTESDHVCRVIHLRTLHIGPDELLVAAKLEFDADLDLSELARAIPRR